MAVAGLPHRQDGHACWLQKIFAELLAELTGPGLPGIEMCIRDSRWDWSSIFFTLSLASLSGIWVISKAPKYGSQQMVLTESHTG